MKDFRYMAIVAAAALGLAVAGCGSSGSDDTASGSPAGADTSLADAKAAAMTAATAAARAATTAEAAANAQEANKDHDAESYALAQDAAMRARAAARLAAAANTAAQAAETADAAETQQAIAERHQATAETERGNAVMHAGMVAAAKSTADENATAAANKAAANKVAMTKKTAIQAEAVAEPTDGAAFRPFDRPSTGAYAPVADGATADSNDGRNYRLQVKYDGDPKVTITDGDLEAKSDPMFTKAAEFGNGQMLVRNVGTDREIIVVHTDIDAPTATPFSRAPGITLDVDTDPDHTGPESIAIVSTADADNHHDGMKSSRFMHSGDQDTSIVPFLAAADGPPAVKASEFSGMYDGAPGTYKCTGSSNCSVTVNKKDEVVAVVGTWQFTPAAGATVSVQDNDYLTYGFWLDTTTKDGAIASYDAVQTFARSSLGVTDETLTDVTGSAKYEGDAAGVYVHETKKEDGTLDTATSGRFTADVALRAYFDESTLRNANTIEGTISKFDLDGGPANSWEVNVSAGITSGFALENGQASGMTGDTGSLTGQFHGTAADRDGTGTGTALAGPPVLVGEFNANFVNGAVAGAYGARKQPE